MFKGTGNIQIELDDNYCVGEFEIKLFCGNFVLTVISKL